MADRPILFSGPMVRALLAGTKTQTRRVLKPQPVIAHWQGVQRFSTNADGRVPFCRVGPDYPDTDEDIFYTPYAVGDRLYVREAWRTHSMFDDIPPRDLTTISIHYEAGRSVQSGRHRAGMHMPRWASRITLIVEDVRVERVADISEDDAKAEGMEPVGIETGQITANSQPIEIPSWVDPFAELWDTLNAKRGFGWDVNPWVVAVSFRVINQNIDREDA